MAICLLFSTALVGCSEEKPLFVSLEQRQPLPVPNAAVAERTLKVCVGSMIMPEEGYGYYRRLLDYLATRMGMRIEVIDPGNYQEVNRLLESGKVDAAFVCGGPYVKGSKDFGLQLIAAPLVNGQAHYYSYLIVPVDSAATSLADLRGHTFAFADPDSNTGLLVPRSRLASMGETPDSFFRSYLFTFAHDRSIRAVADRLVEGAAVDSLIWDYLAIVQPQLTGKTKVIARWGPYGIPPVVATPGLEAAIRERLQAVLLSAHLDPQGKEILEGMHIERFVPMQDAAYDSIRQLYQQPPPDRPESARR
ncbi:MAG: PhnD/SsuA/transferrin family substrate-binding protein [Desulfuromonadales bacterium]|nr:PhnD/SsuA/transferrin family substrate-binding protein [Desulfuromonadales bacterium]